MSALFNGALLRLGRQFRGLTQRELAERISEDTPKVSRIENDVVRPSDAFVAKVAATLALPAEFFQQAETLYGLPLSFHPMWRKKSSVLQSDVDRVLAEVNIRLIHLRRLVRSLDYQPVAPFPKMDPDEHDGDIEAIAQAVRRSWQLPSGPIANLTLVAERAGCFVVHTRFAGVPVDGVTLAVPDTPPCIFLNANQPGDRLRFTLAHEIGHRVMHRVVSDDMEDEANRFARALLMPADDIRPQMARRNIDLPLLARLKLEWRVSMQVLLFRARDLGFVTANQWQYLWKQFNAQRLRLREPPELDVAVERPEIMARVLDLHVRDLGYSLADLRRLLAMHEEEIAELHGLAAPETPPVPRRPALWLVQ